MRIGIDLGGTKIEAIALGADGMQLRRQRVETPQHDYDATLRSIANLVWQFETDLGAVASVGVSHPGAISPTTGLIKNANSTWLNHRDLARDLSRLLERPVRFANDANCFALSEATDGAGANLGVVFGVIVGTGTGGGIVVDGRIRTGPNAIAGEWGHNPLPWPKDGEWPGPPCYCGRTGCIEKFLSGPALASDYERSGGAHTTASQVAALARAGDALAIACLASYEERMARALASVINVLDPDAIVLGGGLSNLDRIYSRVPELWAPFVFSDRVSTPLLRPAYGDSSGVRGAAWLWND